MSENDAPQPRLRKACESCRSVDQNIAMLCHVLLKRGIGKRKRNVLDRNQLVRHAHVLGKDVHTEWLKLAIGYKSLVTPTMSR